MLISNFIPNKCLKATSYLTQAQKQRFQPYAQKRLGNRMHMQRTRAQICADTNTRPDFRPTCTGIRMHTHNKDKYTYLCSLHTHMHMQTHTLHTQVPLSSNLHRHQETPAKARAEGQGRPASGSPAAQPEHLQGNTSRGVESGEGLAQPMHLQQLNLCTCRATHEQRVELRVVRTDQHFA